jgi:urease accessory protein
MKKMIRIGLTGLPVLLLAGAADAHTGHGAVSGLAAGFSHPLGGLDHMLAMIAVGVLGFQLRGRAMWALPATFVAMMVAGGLLGLGGVALPLVELGIVGSGIVLGLAIALGRRLPVAMAAPLAGAFGIFHGHAHGAEMPAGASMWEFGVGFVVATLLLHGMGITLARAVEMAGPNFATAATRISGAAIAVAGLAFATI